MVSIAESFNYRIFERKRRMGEALHESSPCMPHSQCRTNKKTQQNTPRTVKKYVCVFVKIKESPSLLGEIHIFMCMTRDGVLKTHIHTYTHSNVCVCVCVCETKTTQQKNTQRSFFGCGLSHIFSSGKNVYPRLQT